MKISVVGFKGGVGKTTTAVHLAAILQQRAPALLIDGDPNRSASDWAARGTLPFKVEDEKRAGRNGSARAFEHVVIDTEARPTLAELRDLAQDCDLLVIPTTPDALSLKALLLTVGALASIEASKYRILLTIIPPRPSRDGDEARTMLAEQGLPVFKAEIRRAVAFQKAALKGVLVGEVRDDPRALVAWNDYLTMGREIV